MKIEETHSKGIQLKKKEELYFDCQQFISTLRFMEDEIMFIDSLLNSYVFEPNTPNLFEKLQDFNHRLKKLDYEKTKVDKAIIKHENSLGGMLQCADETCDLGFYKKHEILRDEVVALNTIFRTLKSEIFRYAGGILKKKKV